MRITKWKHLAAAIIVAGAAWFNGGAAHAINVGDKAPAFSLPATIGKQASPANFAGKTLVLFFYLGAFTDS